jgi:hypothetical protein
VKFGRKGEGKGRERGRKRRIGEEMKVNRSEYALE